MRRMYSENQLNNKINNAVSQVLPAYPETVENKTYALQLVDGVLTWVEIVEE